MGDISAEPSMEDILSSIKRIIAEEGDGAAATRTRRPVRLPPSSRDDNDRLGHEEILELNDALPDPPRADSQRGDTQRGDTQRAESKRAAEPSAAPAFTSADAEPIVSARAAEASRGPLDALSRLIVKPEVAGSDTLEALVREMLRPMLREWLDAHLPDMVETMVAREIARITEQR